MTQRPSEATKYHTRLMKAGLAIDDCRAYWRARLTKPAPTAEIAFSEYWFGARSLLFLQRLLTDMKQRFEVFPESLQVLSSWTHMTSRTRTLVCHWHLQLADPLYRLFTGEYLPARKAAAFENVKRSVVANWIEEVCPDRWQANTRNQIARKLLYAAKDASLLTAAKNEWYFAAPDIEAESVTYLIYVLKEIDFDGTLTDNLYLKSLGLNGDNLATILRKGTAIKIHRQSTLVDFTWQFDSLADWAVANGIARDLPTGEVA